jgi:SPP1 gp7 family putative phage head morphogenesis protein
MAVKKAKTDPAHDATERLLAEMEQKIAKEYSQAERELSAKIADYFRRFELKDQRWREWVKDGDKTKEEYQAWRVGQMAVGKRWESMKETIAQDLHHANDVARSIAYGYMPDVYAENFNYGTYEAEVGAKVNTSFTLYDKQTVERLMRDDPKLLPDPGKKKRAEIAAGQDVLWNKQQVQSVMMQGILQGESIPKLANRLAVEVGEKDHRAAIRNARTMTTGAQNAGRVDSYKRAEDMGIKMVQEWRATLDMRTRHEHRVLDGQTQKIGEPFEVDGLQIMFPGDPSADPSMIYNCRCTLRAVVAGLEPQARKYRDDSMIEGMTYEEWKESRLEKPEPITLQEEKGEAIRQAYLAEYRRGGRRGDDDEDYDVDSHDLQAEEAPAEETPAKEEKDERVVVNGMDISETWTRREDEFEYAVEDVINAQGFDGLPKIVSAEEFDEAVKAANGGDGFIAQRTYSAPSQEVLDSYRDQLYNGKFYVECSGGALYGQGMYCASNYNGVLSKKIESEMDGYIKLGSERTGANFSYVETFTLDPSAKIVDIHDLKEEKNNYANQFSGRERREILRMDNGAFAAMRGYDVIDCGERRDGQYTVILNRTKLIIKEPVAVSEAPAVDEGIVNGKDLTNTWHRREDQFDFEIEDVINAQGFDGLPKVVPADEFDKYVQESNVIAARGYTAPDQESLDLYHDEFLNGKFYVQCSGGSINGYGMYTAGNFDTKLSEKSIQTTSSYGAGPFGKVETMTFTKDMKFINSNDVAEEKRLLTWEFFSEKLEKAGVELNDIQTDMAKMRCGLTVDNIWEKYPSDKLVETNNWMKQYYDKYLDDAFQYYEDHAHVEPGAFCALRGYDAIVVDVDSNDNKHFVVLNRTKVIVKGD